MEFDSILVVKKIYTKVSYHRDQKVSYHRDQANEVHGIYEMLCMHVITCTFIYWFWETQLDILSLWFSLSRCYKIFVVVRNSTFYDVNITNLQLGLG